MVLFGGGMFKNTEAVRLTIHAAGGQSNPLEEIVG